MISAETPTMRMGEVGQIKQALLLVRVEQALGRDQLENLDPAVDVPAMGRSTRAQLRFSFRKGGVKALLAFSGSFQQEFQGAG